MNSLILVVITVIVLLLTGCATAPPVQPLPVPYQDAATALDFILILISLP